MGAAHSPSERGVLRGVEEARGREDRGSQDGDRDGRGGAEASERPDGSRSAKRDRPDEPVEPGREGAVEDPVREPAGEAEEDRERAEAQRAGGPRLFEGAVDRHEQEGIRDGHGALHPEPPHRLPRREGPRRRARGRGQVREAAASEPRVRREKREVELEKENAGLDSGFRQQKGRKRDERREESLGELERSDRPRGDPRVPEEAPREVPVTDERRLARSRGIREQAVLRLEDRRSGPAARDGVRARSRATRRRRP